MFFLCFISCKDVKKNKCDITESQEFTAIIYKKYHTSYFVDSISGKDRLDFVELYTIHCGVDCKSEYYNIEKAVNLFDKKKGNVFYAELICFKYPNNLDSIIKQIKAKNCIDPYNIKINRIYKLNSQLAIFVNFSNFNIGDFQRKIISKYKECEIIDINTP
ncbi:hypothetical protein DRF57_18095 [Chryseobacterium rhizosphaerae]|uniref:Lipoprotein n=2 Tax=Chryseobacterium rhizosphaerae TaxID=395937 RepID=A0ABX9IGK7_9FLAO|nr:hypothetical protein DRF57_18095 [Chryseobacterium rhizosphaerae]